MKARTTGRLRAAGPPSSAADTVMLAGGFSPLLTTSSMSSAPSGKRGITQPSPASRLSPVQVKTAVSPSSAVLPMVRRAGSSLSSSQATPPGTRTRTSSGWRS